MRRIEHFNWVRDIPYRCPLSSEESDYSCFGKHQVLEKLLKGVGLKVRPRVCDFSWSSLKLPRDVVNIPHQDDIFHVYLEVETNGGWHKIDASFDSNLAPRLPVMEWDGRSSTGLCVPHGKIYSPKVSREIYVSDDEDFSLDRGFYETLNGWLEEVRSTA